MGERELDPRLKAAARSPEAGAMLARKHDDPSSRYRRLLFLVAAVAVAVGLLWAAIAFRLPGARRGPSEPAVEIDRSHYLAPIKTQAVAAGEEVAPFAGFAVSVETEPPGAMVTIRGVPRGEAPVLANVDCRPPERLEITAEKPGFPVATRQLECRLDTLVKVTVQLGR